MAMIEQGIPAAPTLSILGFADPIALPDAAQTIVVTGTPGEPVTLLQVDARLYIDLGAPGGGFDIDPFEANAAMAKVVLNTVIEGDGDVEVPVSLLATTSGDAGPDGGINHFIAVQEMNGPIPRGLTSNTVVVELDPTATLDGTLDGTMLLQGRTDHSGDFELTLYDMSGVQVGDPQTVTADVNGDFSVSGITPGMYQVAVKRSNYLQIVQNRSTSQRVRRLRTSVRRTPVTRITTISSRSSTSRFSRLPSTRQPIYVPTSTATAASRCWTSRCCRPTSIRPARSPRHEPL